MEISESVPPTQEECVPEEDLYQILGISSLFGLIIYYTPANFGNCADRSSKGRHGEADFGRL